MEHDLIHEVAICILVAWMLAVGAQLLKQPLILAYLIAGFAVGPVGIGLVENRASIETISEMGLILLLFMIGLEIDLKKILGTGRLIIATAAIQVLGGCGAGLILFWMFGFQMGGGQFDALYIAVAAALSSTVIIVKLLYEKRELDTLPGRLTLGILVLQDVFAILFLAVQPNLAQTEASALFLSLGKASILVAVAFTASRYALPPLFRAVARLPELVLVGALAWCFLTAGLAEALNLSREMGALIAGVAISTFPYALDVAAKVTTLRDFFLTLFFVALGMAIPAPSLDFLLWALVISLFLVASRFATVLPTLYWMKQGHRASLLPTIHLCQMSELSLVILALGANFQHLSKQTEGIIAYTFVLLAVASTYGIVKADQLWTRLSQLLRNLGLRDLDEQNSPAEHLTSRTIFILGFSWTASSLLEEMTRHCPALLQETRVIDFNPNVNAELRARQVDVVYGDISQRDTLHHAGISEAAVIICSLPNTVLKGTNNLRLLQQLRELNKKARVIMHAELFSDVPKLYEAGADYVSVPRLIEAQELCAVIQAARRGELEAKRAELDKELFERHEVIP